MNGRLNKVAMTAKIMRMKTGLYEKQWYPEWDDRQRGAANRILTNVLEFLDEYWGDNRIVQLGYIWLNIVSPSGTTITLAY